LANVYAIGHFFIVVNDQLLKNNLAIWSQQCVNVGTYVSVWVNKERELSRVDRHGLRELRRM